MFQTCREGVGNGQTFSVSLVRCVLACVLLKLRLFSLFSSHCDTVGVPVHKSLFPCPSDALVYATLQIPLIRMSVCETSFCVTLMPNTGPHHIMLAT